MPESKIRIITGDTGGSFGMKSPIFNEMPLVLLASKLTGRPVKWISTRSEAFLSDAQARDNVTEAELALDKDGTFLGAAREDLRRHRRLSAERHAGLLVQCRHARRHLPHAGDPCRHHRGVHQHQSGAALSRQRPAGSRLTSSNAWSISPPTNSASIRPNCAGATTFRRAPCRSRPGSRSLTTAASSKRTWTWRSSSPTSRASRRARRKRAKRGRLRGFGLSNTIERAAAASHRRRRSALRPLRRGDDLLRLEQPGPGPRDRVQATGLRPARPRSRRRAIRAGRHRRGVLRRRHRRLALGHHGGLRLPHGDGEDRRQGARHRRASAQGQSRRTQFRRRRVSPAKRPTGR